MCFACIDEDDPFYPDTKEYYEVDHRELLTAYVAVLPELDEFLKLNFDYFIFDSITTLLIYQKAEEPVVRFITNFVNKIKRG